MELRTYLSIPGIVVASLALILYVLTYLFRSSDSSLSTDYRRLLTTNKPHLAGKKAKF